MHNKTVDTLSLFFVMVEYMNIYLGMNFFIPFLDNHILKCIRFFCIFEFYNFNATFGLTPAFVISEK